MLSAGGASIDGYFCDLHAGLQASKGEAHEAMANMVCFLWFMSFSLTETTTLRMFDVSKQVAGQMFVHGLNLFISDTAADHSSGNPCVLYFLNILIDTTFGA